MKFTLVYDDKLDGVELDNLHNEIIDEIESDAE